MSCVLNEWWGLLTVMNIEQWTIGSLTRRRLKFPLRATLLLVIHSQCFFHTSNEKKEVNKSFSVQWPLNS